MSYRVDGVEVLSCRRWLNEERVGREGRGFSVDEGLEVKKSFGCLGNRSEFFIIRVEGVRWKVVLGEIREGRSYEKFYIINN